MKLDLALSLPENRNRQLADGGDEGDRTPDPLLAKQVLSQLSYTPGVLPPRSRRPSH